MSAAARPEATPQAVMAAAGHRAPPPLLPLLREVGDLKRIRSAGRMGSTAERLFGAAWARIAAGEAPGTVARQTCFAALAATRLGDLDALDLAAVGVPAAEVARIRHRAAQEAAGPLDPAPRAWLLGGEDEEAPSAAAPPPPSFVARLAAQPRAGATCPGRGRLVLEPPESHADHCLAVAVGGALLAPAWGALADTVFLAGLAHHLHNALLPDTGFAGEVLLGDWLEPAFARSTDMALAELAPAPRAAVEAARQVLSGAGTPEGCAFHAADTLDRVLQVEHHLRAAGTTMDYVLRDMELVHVGPVKPFQDAVLARMGLAA